MDRLYIYFMFIPIMAFHGFIQAWVAHLLGDDTARNEGRMTLSPVSHIDLWGTLIMPAVNLLLNPSGYGLIGWGRPIPVDPYGLRQPKRDEILIALSGPIANLILAFLTLLSGRFLVTHDPILGQLVTKFAFTATFLALFNFVPIPPLDGWTIVRLLFNLPVNMMEMGSIWWSLGILAFLNFTPFMSILVGLTQVVVNLMSNAVGLEIIGL